MIAFHVHFVSFATNNEFNLEYRSLELHKERLSLNELMKPQR